MHRLSRLLVERMLRPWYHPNLLWNLSIPGRKAGKFTKTLIAFTEKLIAKRRQLFNQGNKSHNPKAEDEEDIENLSKQINEVLWHFNIFI